MSDYHRWRRGGGMYFFTVVTFGRRPILTAPAARLALHEAIVATQRERPFEQVACVLLSDHLHCLWQFPDTEDDYSLRWRLIKSRFTRRLIQDGFSPAAPSASRGKRNERAIWQRRFWEHSIRDEVDAKRHLDYIHFNPVKHGHVAAARDWPYSTFGKFLRQGEYDADWGQAEPETLRGWNIPGE